MPNYQVNISGLIPEYADWTGEANNKIDAEAQAREYVERVFPDMTEIRVDEVIDL